MDDTPLSEILEPNEPEEVTETPEQTAERERDELGRFKAKDTGEEAEPEPSATPAPEPEQERVPLTALKDERSKRQQAEDRLRQYDEYFAQLNQQPQTPQEVPDPFVDPQGHQAYVIEQAVRTAIERLTPTLQQERTMSRAEMSEMLARQKFPDYDEKIEVFKEAIRENPFLIHEVQKQADPATYAYNQAIKYQEARAGATMPTREQLKAELREELMSELNLRPQVPSTLADARSVGSRSGPAWSDPTLAEILHKP